ncbi:MAG: GDP-mannose 4,6-dehydratase [Oligoflexia bacterium]|nr:GDP-mannose 4,6-dehydratase [Oligoflexia bacterium]
MAGKKIAVVTGGAGFIGSHMVDLLLNEGFQVRVIDNLTGGRLANLAHHKSNTDLTVDTRDLRSLKPDDKLFSDAQFVFHYAGKGDIVPSIVQPLEYMSVNVMGTIHALECARAAKVQKFVYAASSSCYGLTDELPTKETSLIKAEYPYALSKYQGEMATFHWGKVYNLPVNSVRIFNAYGPRSKTTGAYGAVFGVFLAQVLANKPLTVVGDGTQTRDFVFVKDLVRAFYEVAKSAPTLEMYNVGAGKPQSVNRLVELLGAKEIVHLPKRPGEPDCTWADITKITTSTKWRPQVSFEDGVNEMLKNIDYWREAPVWDPESIKAATADWFNYLS